MYQPTPGDVHVNVPLTNVSIAFLQKATNFVAARVFPIVPVMKQSDRYYTYDRGDFNRDEMEQRAPGTESAGSGYRLDNTPTYYAPKFSLHKDIPDEMRSNADSVLNVDREAVQFLMHKALIRREKIFSANYMQTGRWTFDRTGVAAAPGANQFLQWNDANSNPIEDIRRYKTVMMENTGMEANKLVLGRPVYDVLVDHPDVIDRVKAGQTPGGPAKGTLAAMAELFELEEILVMNAIENTAGEGLTNVHQFIGGKRALLVHSAQAPGLMTPSAGYTFSWTGLMGAGNEGNRIKTFRMEPLSADRVELDMAFDMKLVAADLGVFLNNAVA